MALLGTLAVSIIGDMRQLDDTLTRVGTSMQGLGSKLQNIGSKITSIGQTMTMAITLPVAAIGVASFKMAADLQDAMGAADQIYQGSSQTVKDWASNLESYYGIAEGEALSYANMMGTMLQNIGGLTEEQAASQAATLIELAGDLTAMYGGTTQDAVRALTGALKGNNSMLDNYGIACNEATIKSKALEMGLITEGEEMSLAAKQAATLAIITEQTAAAQGQAAREADGASGSWRTFTTELKKTGEEIGMVLLPILTPMIQKLRDMVAAFRELDPGIQTAIIAIAAVAAAIGPVLIVVGMLVSAVGTIITGFGAAAAAIGAISAPVIAVIAVAGVLVGIFVAATVAVANFLASNEEAQQKLGEIWGKIQEVVQPAIDGLMLLWETFGDDILEFFDTMWEAIKIAFETAILNILDIVMVFLSLMTGDTETAGAKLQEIWDRIWAAVVNIFGLIWGKIQPKLVNLYVQMNEWFTGLKDKALAWGRNIISNIADGIMGGVGRIGEVMGTVAAKIRAYMPFSPAKEGPLRDIMEFGPNIVNAIAGGIKRNVYQFRDVMTEIGETITRSIESFMEIASGVMDTKAQDLAKTAAESIQAAANEYNTNVDKALTDLQQKEDALTENYTKTLDQRSSALAGWIGLFDAVPEKVAQSGTGLMQTLQDQVTHFQTWQAQITQLSAKAIDEGLIAELRKMGPKALSEIQALNAMSETELAKYSELYQEKQELAREQAGEELQGLQDETAAKIEALHKETNTQLEQYAIDFVTKIEGIKVDTLNQMQLMSDGALASGRGLMGNLINGIYERLPELRTAMMAVATTVDSYMPHSPAKVGPLKDIMEWGPALVDSLTTGIEGRLGELQSSMAMTANVIAAPMYAAPAVAGTSAGQSIHQSITINSPEPLSAAEVARKYKQASRELAMEWVR